MYITRQLLLILLVLCSLNAWSQTEDVVQKGQRVPDFTFRDIQNNTISMSDFKGKVVLINFFATWCGPCNAEMPLLQEKVWQKYKDNKNFQILSFGRGHTSEEVIQFKKEKQLGFPMYADADKSIYNLFATIYIPRNYIIDSTGTIVYQSKGFSEEEFKQMETVLDSLLTK